MKNLKKFMNGQTKSLKKKEKNVSEYKKDIRQSEGLIIGIIVVCLIISFITGEPNSKYIF